MLTPLPFPHLPKAQVCSIEAREIHVCAGSPGQSLQVASMGCGSRRGGLAHLGLPAPCLRGEPVCGLRHPPLPGLEEDRIGLFLQGARPEPPSLRLWAQPVLHLSPQHPSWVWASPRLRSLSAQGSLLQVPAIPQHRPQGPSHCQFSLGPLPSSSRTVLVDCGS